MRVVALHFNRDAVPNACQTYRANMPLWFLGQRPGWETSWERFDVLVEKANQIGKRAYLDFILQHDLFVFPRVAVQDPRGQDGVIDLIRVIRKAGKRVVYEIDDDYTNLHRNLEHMGVFNAMKIASWCDAVTATTPYLAKLMEQQAHRPAYVLPNSLDPALWRRPEKHLAKEALVIGLSGSTTHQADWDVLAAVIRQILANDYGKDVRFRLTGFHPSYLQGLPKTDYLAAFDMSGYAEMVRSCDIVLAPVDPHDRFNDAKSPIKVVEGMGATRPVGSSLGGAACIATKNAVYALAITDRKDGLLVEHTPESWYTAIDSLIRNDPLRQQLQQAAHASVWKRFDMSRTWTLWAQAYQKIRAKESNSLPLVYAS